MIQLGYFKNIIFFNIRKIYLNYYMNRLWGEKVYDYGN